MVTRPRSDDRRTMKLHIHSCMGRIETRYSSSVLSRLHRETLSQTRQVTDGVYYELGCMILEEFGVRLQWRERDMVVGNDPWSELSVLSGRYDVVEDLFLGVW